jgi:hypothetical protein
MTQADFDQILNSLNGLTPQQMQRLQRELESKMAATPAPPRPDDDPILGLMRDDVELMDEIVADAYRHRREETWREFDV